MKCKIFITYIMLVFLLVLAVNAKPKETVTNSEPIEFKTELPTVHPFYSEVSVEEQETELVTETEVEAELISLGEFKLTAYCSCVKCCGKWAYDRPNGIAYGASGEELIAGYSIAVDPTVIPYGTEAIINGHTYRADDCGGAVKGNIIDIYYNSHEDALHFGAQYAEVFIKRED